MKRGLATLLAAALAVFAAPPRSAGEDVPGALVIRVEADPASPLAEALKKAVGLYAAQHPELPPTLEYRPPETPVGTFLAARGAAPPVAFVLAPADVLTSAARTGALGDLEPLLAAGGVDRNALLPAVREASGEETAMLPICCDAPARFLNLDALTSAGLTTATLPAAPAQNPGPEAFLAGKALQRRAPISWARTVRRSGAPFAWGVLPLDGAAPTTLALAVPAESAALDETALAHFVRLTQTRNFRATIWREAGRIPATLSEQEAAAVAREMQWLGEPLSQRFPSP